MQQIAAVMMTALALTTFQPSDSRAQTRLIVPGAATAKQAAPPQIPKPKAEQSPAPQQPDRTKLETQLINQLRLSIAKCWKDDAAAPTTALVGSIQPSVAVLVFDLRADGKIIGGPNILHRRGAATAVVLAQTAQRAVKACAPYRNLPSAAFEHGKRRIQMSFDQRGL